MNLRQAATIVIAGPENSNAQSYIIARHRVLNPKSRAENLTPIEHNGTSVREYRYLACGEVGARYCVHWPITKQAQEWLEHHESLKCLEVAS